MTETVQIVLIIAAAAVVAIVFACGTIAKCVSDREQWRFSASRVQAEALMAATQAAMHDGAGLVVQPHFDTHPHDHGPGPLGK